MSGLKERLQNAVRSEEMPPFLEARVRGQIRDTRRPALWPRFAAPAALATMMCAGIFVAYQAGHLRLTRDSEESYIKQVSNQVGLLMRVGLGDHVHCAYFRKFPANPPTVDEMVKKLGPAYAGLLPILRSEVPPEFHPVIGHECSYHQRKFIHISMKSDSNLMSLIVARKADGESFSAEGLVPALRQSGLPVYQSEAQRFQIASFESNEFLVYVISDLSKERNIELMRAMAPSLKVYLAKLEKS